MFDFKNYRNPALFFIEEIVLVVLFFALVIEKPRKAFPPFLSVSWVS